MTPATADTASVPRARFERATARRAARSSAPSSAMAELAALEPARVFDRLATSERGLGEEAARRILELDGPNEVASSERRGWAWRLLRVMHNPLIVLLLLLAGISLAAGDRRAAIVIALMVALGVLLRFVQESRANAAADALRSMIHVNTTVVRDGVERELPLRDVVRGDVIELAAGDMVPADIRLVAAKDLYVNQAALTGESLPVERSELPDWRPDVATHELQSLCFLGTSVQSGTATGVVIATGARTTFGHLAERVAQTENVTAFDRGVDRFTWLMIRLIGVMVPLVFVVNGLTKHDWRGAFFFALAVAVGLAPEMLPMIVSVSLARGALAMSRKKVIVKRLDAIQNFGAMDVLCTDKTGTLTMDQVLLERHCDLRGGESLRVLLHAYLISHFQTGLRNVLDNAILAHRGRHPELHPSGWTKVDEIPFDFARRIMSVVVQPPEGPRLLVAKGACEEIFQRCAAFELDGARYPVLPALLDSVREEYDKLSADGFRVLAVAFREVQSQPEYSAADERDLVLAGYVAFLDPPKESAAPALAALARAGVSVKVLTGDNELVSRTICGKVGVPTDEILLGADVDRLGDEELGAAVERVSLLARLSPVHKERIIRALQRRGHTVGFLGDGINDAPALHAADVGVSVDSAVDIAKEAADIVLLEKSLTVLRDGAIEGRKVFSNILKYVRMGASSNFGNMFSVVGASALLPFLPMAPLQVLTNNLLYDFSQVPIPSDNVDPEQTAVPQPWHMREIWRFILLLGPISSLFDYTTFAAMWFVFGARTPAHAALFQTGWFVESLLTQTLVIHIIRTSKLPFVRSRASWPLTAMTLTIATIGISLPLSPLASTLGFVALPSGYWPILAATLSLYGLAVFGVGRLLRRRMLI